MSATLSRQKFDDVSSTGYQHCTRKRTYTEDDEEQPHNTYKRARASAPFPLSPSSTIHDNLRQKPIESRSIEPWENDTESKPPRLIDLSTGEILEQIPSIEQKDRPKLKVGKDSTFCEYIQDVGSSHEGEFTLGSDKDSERSAFNYIEENLGSAVDIMQKLKGTSIGGAQSVSTSNVAATNSNIETSQNLSMVLKNKNARFKFTDQYQQAFDKYMRSQIDYIDDGACGIYGKEVVLYRPNQDEYITSSGSPIIKEITDTNDIAEGKIVEITEDDIEMCDVEADTSEAIMEIEPFCDQEVYEVDKMDID